MVGGSSHSPLGGTQDSKSVSPLATHNEDSEYLLFTERPSTIRSFFAVHYGDFLEIPWDAVADVVCFAVLMRQTLTIATPHNVLECDVVHALDPALTDIVALHGSVWPKHVLGPEFMRGIAFTCERLHRLDLPHVMIDDAAFCEVPPRCPYLQHLDISGACALTDKAILCVAEHCRHLTYLSIRETDGNITDIGVSAIATACTSLSHLDVSSTAGQVTNESIVNVALRCSVSIRFLSVADTCAAISDKAITAIAHYCRNLQRLDVSETHGKVTDAALCEIARGCPRLEHLSVSATSGKVTDEGIVAIAKKCRGLRHLDVSGTKGYVTDTAIIELQRNCPFLSYLDVTNANGKISRKSLANLMVRCTIIR